MRIKVLYLTSLAGNVPDPRGEDTVSVESSEPHFCNQTWCPWGCLWQLVSSVPYFQLNFVVFTDVPSDFMRSPQVSLGIRGSKATFDSLWSILRTPSPSLQASGNLQELWSQPCHLEFPDTVWECVYPGKTEFPGIVPGHPETRDPLGHQGHHTRIPGPHHTLEMKGSLYYITFPGGNSGKFSIHSRKCTDNRPKKQFRKIPT